MVLRALASSDIDDAVAYLRDSAGEAVARAFIDSLETAINRITRSPNSGSPRFGFDLGIPDLRATGLKRFPYAIFYVTIDERIDIWRVLHTRRDVPRTFGDID